MNNSRVDAFNDVFVDTCFISVVVVGIVIVVIIVIIVIVATTAVAVVSNSNNNNDNDFNNKRPLRSGIGFLATSRNKGFMKNVIKSFAYHNFSNFFRVA